MHAISPHVGRRTTEDDGIYGEVIVNAAAAVQRFGH
jgi:hypothetical protein